MQIGPHWSTGVFVREVFSYLSQSPDHHYLWQAASIYTTSIWAESENLDSAPCCWKSHDIFSNRRRRRPSRILDRATSVYANSFTRRCVRCPVAVVGCWSRSRMKTTTCVIDCSCPQVQQVVIATVDRLRSSPNYREPELIGSRYPFRPKDSANLICSVRSWSLKKMTL